MKPIIALASRQIKQKDSTPRRMGCDEGYIESVLTAGATPLIIPITEDRAALATLLNISAGLILCGGEDVHPSHYGEEETPELSTVDVERDRCELTLLELAEKRQLPILAICRGVQLLNVFCGGTLYQDLDTHHPEAEGHDPKPGFEFSRWHEETHPVRLKSGSTVERLFGTDSILTNSLHHQSIKELGTGLTVTGTSDDGIIECVEGTGARFIVGVQFHPENMWQRTNPNFLKLFTALVEAAEVYRRK